MIPNGNHYIVQEIASPGLWSIESDSDDSYLEEVYQEERATLVDMLHELGIEAS